MSYKVEIWHHMPVYRRGDLESDTEYSYHTLKTRKEAKELIENRLRRLKNVKRDYHKGLTPSNCYGWTGKTWTNENTGEQEEEVYRFKLTQE